MYLYVYVCNYRMVENFGESATVKHWEKILCSKNYYKALNYILVKPRIVKVVVGQLPCVKMMFSYAVDSMIHGYHK